ncbi:MAG: Eco57I restriction-modification methylase domain-containing protein [Bacillota bacterium]
MSRFVAVRAEGGLLPADILERAAAGDLPGQASKDFGLPPRARLSEEIARAWSDAQSYWAAFKRRMARVPESDLGTSDTREYWVRLLLDLLGYELVYQPSAAVVGDRAFPVSHRAGTGAWAPPVHVEGFRVDLDRRVPGRMRVSPQAMLQEYLNRSEHLWGVLTNGIKLRLLRQTPRISGPSYVEFDLQSIFDGDRFGEFGLLWRLCHRTRLPVDGQEPSACLLELYYQEGLEQGSRAREKLREGVEKALVVLGNALLQHPDNQALRESASRPGFAEDFYRQLLQLVYRLLFLLVAEERHLVFPEGPERAWREEVYRECYSVSRLRDLCERGVDPGPFCDLWLGLWVTFSLFENGRGENALGVPALNGHLFGPDALPGLRGTRVWNNDLVDAFRHLSLFRDERVLRRVNYAAIDVEELGSVYESLLDYHPYVGPGAGGRLEFQLLYGTERKSTGSYYTPRELVAELVESALVPVMEQKLKAVKTKEDKEKAILGMAVCDPASGSGHFLLAAARRMGRELAKVREEEEEPSAEAFRRAVRDVISNCIYAVDVNPLAVDLCKLALWIEAHDAGKPLTFLDHRIKCGDSLVGLFRLAQLEDGIPEGAFEPVFGDDKALARRLRAENRRHREMRENGLMWMGLSYPSSRVGQHREAVEAVGRIPDDTVDLVREKERVFLRSREPGTPWWRDRVAADLWAAAFFVPLTAPELAITEPDLQNALAGGLDPAKAELAEEVARRVRFFHWELEFPEVFARGGFDVVLGNPPWERIKLQEEEFFASRELRIARAPNRAERQRMIRALEKEDPALWLEYQREKHRHEAHAKFLRNSGRFPLGARGDINTYLVFAELARSLLGRGGRAGFIVPTGLATDHTSRHLFSDLVSKGNLVSLFDFENRGEGGRRLFPAVHVQYRFCLLTIEADRRERADFAFFLLKPDQIRDERRRMALGPKDLELFNPNTGTCPIFRTRYDYELTRKIYERVPVLVNERTGENPWGIRFATMFHMSNDSHLFRTRHQLRRAGYVLEGNRFVKGGDVWLPLYEAKMMHQFDHRWGTYDGLDIRDCTDEEKRDPAFVVMPRYWVPAQEVESRLSGKWNCRWMVGFRRITNATNERTAIFAILPRVGAGDSVFLILPNADPLAVCCLLGNLNSLVYDYVVRNKIAGTNLNFFLVQQTPVIPPTWYTPRDLAFIVPRVLSLTCTSHDLEGFRMDVIAKYRANSWDCTHRAVIRAELDAYYARLYGLTRREFVYILDPREVFGSDFPGETFRVLASNELVRYSEYRTKRLVLEAWDRLAIG